VSLLVILIIIPLAVAAALMLLFVLNPPSEQPWPEDLIPRKSRPLPGVDVDGLENLIANTRHDHQVELERATADPRSKQRYEDYWRERERVDPKP